MSQQEFETYLALLTRLLRISPQNRQRVAEEFRSHMEDRLDDLLARGVPRDDAVRQAIEEFGDAAVLAAEFVSISRNKRRRWLMRITTASVAAIVLIAAGIVTFWPGSNAGPGRAQVVAQNQNQPADIKPALGDAAKKPDATVLTDKLDERIEVDFVETPLKDVFDFLGEKTQITFWINSKKLEEAGVSVDTPITFHFNRIRLSTFLDIMLDQHNLVYVEKDDILVVTSREDAEATTEVRVYDCRDLLTMPTVGQSGPGGMMPGGGGPGYPGDASGFPGSGGYGGAQEIPGTGFSPPGAAIPSVPGSPEAGSADPFAPGGSAPPGARPAPRSKRSEILPQLAPGAGGSPMMPGMSAGGRGMMGPGGMGVSSGGGMGGMGGGFAGEQQPQRPLTAEELKAEQLMNIVTTAVDPDSWQEMGGIGTIGEYNGLIVVRQTARTHMKVEKVLDMLREAANLPKSKTPRVVR